MPGKAKSEVRDDASYPIIQMINYVFSAAHSQMIDTMVEDLAKNGVIHTHTRLMGVWSIIRSNMATSLKRSHSGNHWAFSLVDCRKFFDDKSIKARMRTPVSAKVDDFTSLNDIMAETEDEYEQERAAGVIEQVQQQEVQVVEEVVYFNYVIVNIGHPV